MNMPTNTLLTLYSNPTCVDSHRVRFLSAEKENLVEIVDAFPHDPPENLLKINPYGNLPTLTDRDVTLRSAVVMLEYLDERFPSPTLMPIDPIGRAKVRMMLGTIQEEWHPSFNILNDLNSTDEEKDAARTAIRALLLQLKPSFEMYKYCMTDHFTMIDISLTPLLWRLKHCGIKEDDLGGAFNNYCNRLFKRKAFLASLSLFERKMR